MKKLSLENSGDLPITFQWVESTFGPHFSISPRGGKLSPGNEIIFDVIFKPVYLDEDISQDNMVLSVPGLNPLLLTCTGTYVSVRVYVKMYGWMYVFICIFMCVYVGVKVCV